MKKRNILKKSRGLPVDDSLPVALTRDAAGDNVEATAKAATVSGESQIR